MPKPKTEEARKRQLVGLAKFRRIQHERRLRRAAKRQRAREQRQMNTLESTE